MSKTFGERLSNLRKMNGLSQADLASRLGFTAHTIISRWEKNEAFPNFKHLIRLKEILDVDLHWLITGENFNPQKRIQAQFKETYSSLLKECQEAQDAVQRLEAKKQSGQSLTAAEERELLTCRGIERTVIRQMENAMQAASKELNTPGSDNNK